MNLFKTPMEKEYIIDSVEIKGKEQRRLFDLGLVPGSKIKKVFKSIFNDPIAYEIKKTTIAIRNEDAKFIEVREKNE
jgi:Fe2+ transport system protein FeoA